MTTQRQSKKRTSRRLRVAPSWCLLVSLFVVVQFEFFRQFFRTVPPSLEKSLWTFTVEQNRISASAVAGMEQNNETVLLRDSPLPEALKPVTFEGCCGAGKNTWEQICLTEQACMNNSLYPFASLEEKAILEPWQPTEEEKRRHQKDCIVTSERIPPMHWCNKRSSDRFMFGCSNYNMGGGSGPYDRVLLFPRSQLAFCGIPKVGITQWIQFLRFTLGAKDYQALPYAKKDISPFSFDRLMPSRQDEIWSNWTKAVFLRDPAERLLSAYLDKVETIHNVTFEQFVNSIVLPHRTRRPDRIRMGLHWWTDPHWRPQAWSCGLSEHLPDFDFVSTLDHAARDTKDLLQRVDMWENYGKHYRVSPDSKKEHPMPPPPGPLKAGEVAPGFQQVSKSGEAGMDTQGHNTRSRSKLDRYYTPALMSKVKKLYWMDFALWEAAKEVTKDGAANGKDVSMKLKPDCALDE